MCGFFGVIARSGESPCLSDRDAIRLRDLLQHRGPDDAGLWRRENALLTHRRLIVRHLGGDAAQPMLSQSGDLALVYNGELYNDAELRRDILRFDRRPFQTTCDTETALRALELWGQEAIAKFRGMFALALWDRTRRRLTLARDPLGIKPLYHSVIGAEFVFASEPAPILNHPRASVAPNLAMVSAYLTTIRTVIGADTLFEGLLAVEPGQILSVEPTKDAPRVSSRHCWRPPVAAEADSSDDCVRAAVASSVEHHLCADVPVCALLSGGLDSTITTSVAQEHVKDLRTYAAGAETDDPHSDLQCARAVAQELGVRHDQAIVNRELFLERWPSMIAALGVPLSTPNEVAIFTVAQRLRADGCIVTISGEGADEFFGGYEAPLLAAWQFSRMEGASAIGGRFQLESNAWIASRAKSLVFNPDLWEALDHDVALVGVYDDLFRQCEEEAGPLADPAEAHLRFLQKVNLVGLLQRLDTATMLAGVEGRTPLADIRIAELACGLPMHRKFSPGDAEPDDDGGVAVQTRTRSKIALRAAFRGRVPSLAIERPKASFPLPFQDWVGGMSPRLEQSEFARAIFTKDAIETVARTPHEHWRLAWPMMNIALWADHWWR